MKMDEKSREYSGFLNLEKASERVNKEIHILVLRIYKGVVNYYMMSMLIIYIV